MTPGIAPADRRRSGAAQVGAVLARLAAVHGIRAERVARVWQSAGEAAFRDPAPSSICDDGTPFELSVTIGDRPGGLRYLTEIVDGERGQAQLADTRRRLPELLDLLGLPYRPLLDRVDDLLPRPAERFPDLAFGLWVCPVLLPNESRLKVYVNTSWWPRRPGPADGFRRALRQTLAARGFDAPPAFVGLECTGRSLCRTKCYVRGQSLSRPGLSRPGLSRDRTLALATPADAGVLADLWDAFLGGRDLAPDDGVLSLRLTASDMPEGVKIDFAAKAAGLPGVELPGRIESVARGLDLDPSAYLQTLEASGQLDGGFEHTLIGITAAAGRPRISVYLKPVLRDPRSLARTVRSVLSTRPAYADRPMR